MLKALTLTAAAALFSVGAHASSLGVATFGGPDDPSLHGATGSFEIVMVGADTYDVTWTINTTGYDDTEAISGGHESLEDVAWKAPFSSVSSVSLLGFGGDVVAPIIDTTVYPAQFNGDCSSGPSGFVCLTLTTPQDMLTDGKTYSFTWRVVGTLGDGDVSFRGDFSGTGWVISEEAPPVPEPTSAAVFGLGALLVGAALRKRSK